MCILPIGGRPSSTRLYSIPVKIESEPWRCLMYSNDLENVEIKDGKIVQGFSFKRAIDGASPVAPSVMVVPFPNPTGGTRFGLISGNDTRLFRQQYREKFRGNEIQEMRDIRESFSRRGLAPVFKIGNYICSVVPNLAELRRSINWSEFNVPPDFQERMKVFDDQSIIGETSGFVVAKAIENVKDDGFGIVYPDDGQVFFPTCHENEPSKRYSYDVCLYAFNVAPEHNMPEDASVPGVRRSEVCSASSVSIGSYYTFPMIYTDGTSGTLTMHTSLYSHVSFRHIKGEGTKNCNVIYPANSSTGKPWVHKESPLQKPHFVDHADVSGLQPYTSRPDVVYTAVMCSCSTPFTVSIEYNQILQRCLKCHGQAWIRDAQKPKPSISHNMCGCKPRATGKYDQMMFCGTEGTFAIVPRCDGCKGQAWPESPAPPASTDDKPFDPKLKIPTGSSTAAVDVKAIPPTPEPAGIEDICEIPCPDGDPYCEVLHTAAKPAEAASDCGKETTAVLKPVEDIWICQCTVCDCLCDATCLCGCSPTSGCGYPANDTMWEPTPKPAAATVAVAKPTSKPFEPLDRVIMQKVINEGVYQSRAPKAKFKMCSNCAKDTNNCIEATVGTCNYVVCLDCVRKF